ncbi:unnamed protein product, partial [Mesorhabditis spiculigera]
MDFEDFEWLRPAVAPFFFYVFAFASAEIARRISDWVLQRTVRNYQDSYQYLFMNELIGTALMCGCVWENGLIVQAFGWKGFGITVAALLTGNMLWNRRACVSPLMPIENGLYGSYSPKKTITILTAQLLGGIAAPILAHGVWWHTRSYSIAHRQAHFNLRDGCEFSYKTDFVYACLWEFVGAFLIRAGAPILSRISPFTIPVFIASLLSAAMVYVGIPGLNPTVVTSRLWHCRGLSANWFFLLYWFCPLFGWFFGAEVYGFCTNKRGRPIEATPKKDQSKDKNKPNKKRKYY